MNIVINKFERLIKIVDEGAVYKIGFDENYFNKTEKEIKELAISKYNEIKYREANPLPPTYQELRAKKYLAKGLTTDKLIVALWEKVIENRPESANELQSKREEVKKKYPKG